MHFSDKLSLFIANDLEYINSIMHNHIKAGLCMIVNPRLYFRMKCLIKQSGNTEQFYGQLNDVINKFQNSILYNTYNFMLCVLEDISLFVKYGRLSSTLNRIIENDFLSVVMVVKDEAKYLKEIIEFYKTIGIDRIYLYDNDSTDNIIDTINEYRDSGFVDYIKCPGRGIQSRAYRHAIRRTKNNTTWLAIVDADEFLFSPCGNIKEQLKLFSAYPAVGVNWVMFGPNGHITTPKESVIKSYTTTFKDRNDPYNCRIKSIVQPKQVLYMRSTHYAIYKHNRYAVSENFEEIDGSASFRPGLGRAFTSYNHRNIFRINHYYTKSIEDLMRKCARGYADNSASIDMSKQLSIYLDKEMMDDFEINNVIT